LKYILPNTSPLNPPQGNFQKFPCGGFRGRDSIFAISSLFILIVIKLHKSYSTIILGSGVFFPLQDVEEQDRCKII
jgi:hypothetical protein